MEFDPLAPPRHWHHFKRESSVVSPHFRSNTSSFEVTESTATTTTTTTPPVLVTGGVTAKKRRRSIDGVKDIKTELYEWWDDEIEDGQLDCWFYFVLCCFAVVYCFRLLELDSWLTIVDLSSFFSIPLPWKGFEVDLPFLPRIIIFKLYPSFLFHFHY